MTEPAEAEIEAMRDLIARHPVAEFTISFVLQAWFEPDYPSPREIIKAEKDAAAVIDSLARAALTAAAQVRERAAFPPVRPFKTDWVAVAAGLTPEDQGEDVLGTRKGEE